MIDLSSLKAPGWQRVVAELTANCPDDKTFLDRLLRVMARVSAARQAAVYLPGGDASGPDVRAISVWPAPGPGGEDRVSGLTDATTLEYAAEARSAAASALETGEAKAYGLEKKKSALYGVDSGGEGVMLAVPLPGPDGKPAAAVTLLVEPRSKQAVQSTLAMAEVLAGYVTGHSARQQLRRTQAASFALDLASKLIGSLNTASNFKGASLQLVNDLAKQFHAERAALGWVKHDTVKVVAISDTEHFDRRMTMVQKLEAAMDECLDQEQPVVFPPPNADVDVLLAQAIAHSHRELAASGTTSRVSVCSVPLRDGEKVVGVVTLEFAAAPGSTAAPGPIDLQTVELFQASMDLVAPVLALRKSDNRHLAMRAWDDTVKAGAWLVGPKHTVWKMVGVLATAGLLFVTFYTTTYRIGADAALQPRTKCVISVPYEGLIKEVPEGVEAGAVVRKGDLLVQMDTSELELQAEEATQNILKAQADLNKARSESKPHEAEQAFHDAAIAQSTLTAARTRIGQSRLVAPVDGTILAGKPSERVGSSVKTGEKLFEIAPLGDMVVLARVDERDIAMITPGTKGHLATRAHPSETIEFVVEAVVPLAEAEEGKNLFEVRAKLVSPPPAWLRPGMEGIAKLDTQERSLLYIGTRRILDAIRLWLW